MNHAVATTPMLRKEPWFGSTGPDHFKLDKFCCAAPHTRPTAEPTAADPRSCSPATGRNLTYTRTTDCPEPADLMQPLERMGMARYPVEPNT